MMSSPDIVPQRRLRSSSAHQRSYTPSRFTSPPPPTPPPLTPHPAKRRRLTLLPKASSGGNDAEVRYSDDSSLKPSPIRRTYICKHCPYNSTNPREFLYHQKENHGLKQSIKECPYCTYATIYTHKLLRHMTLVHKNIVGNKAGSVPPSIAKLVAAPQSPPRSNERAISTMYPGSISPSRLPPPSVVSSKQGMGSNKSQMVLPPDLEMIPVSQSRGAHSLLKRSLSKNNVSMIVVPKFKPSTNHSAKTINEALAANREKSPSKNLSGSAGLSFQTDKCAFTPFKSVNKVLAERQDKVAHFKKKFYRCTKCSYITNVRSRYTKHVRYHTMPYIKCELCDFSTPYKWNLDRHRKNHLEEPEGGVGNSDGMYRCHLCTFHTLTKQSLSGHLMNHHAEGGGRKRRRPIEEGGLYSEADLSQDPDRNADAEEYEGENEEDEDEEEDGEEEEDEHGENGLEEEEYEEMNGEKKVEENGTTKAVNADVRKSSRANVNGDKQQGGMVQCDLCPYKAKWISEVDRHRRVHANEKPFECGKCPFSTRWKGDLTRHLSKYHPDVPDKDAIVENIDMLLDQSMQIGGAEELEVYNQEQNKQMQQRGVVMSSSSSPSPMTGARKSNNDKASSFKKSPQIDYKVLGQLIKGQSMKQKITAPVQLSASVQLIPTNSSQSSEKRSAVEEKRPGASEGPIIRKKYQCPQCSLLVFTPSGLSVHLQHHVKAYACSECNYKGDESEVVTHLKRAITLKDHKHQAATVTKIKNLPVEQEKPENMEKYAIYETVNIVKKAASGNNDGANSVLSKKILMQSNKAKEMNPMSKNNSGKKSGSNVIYKCKYCEFRDPNRKTILRHLQVHTANKPFWCGICGQSSNSKNTILRHCQVRHNVSGPIIQRDTASLKNKSAGKEAKERGEGEASGEQDEKEEKQEEDPGFVIVEDNREQQKLQQDEIQNRSSLESNGSSGRSGKKHQCPICPYRCRKMFDLRIHSYMHKPHKESEYKCSYCPFYTSLKGSLLNHLKLHTDYSGYSSSDSIPQLDKSNSSPKSNNNSSANSNYYFTNSDNSFANSVKKAKSDSLEKSGSSPAVKRFSCEQCPYSTNSHTTYFYHRQFHRPSKTAVFKCGVCSYSVSKLHLLHQHEKVHDEANKSVPTSPRRVENREFVLSLTPTPPPPPLTPPPIKMGRRNDQSTPTLPRVWVHRDGVFKKMFKCRHCPHVSKKRNVIFEHEKMHKLRETPGSKANYHCHLCNYSCMNGGILTSHMRVHKAQNSSNFYISDTLDEDLPTAKSRWTSTPKATARKVINASKESIGSSTVKRSLEDEVQEVEEEEEVAVKMAEQLPRERRRHGKVSYACSYCPARFNTMVKKSVHTKFHGVNLKYKCTYCNYSANHRPHLHRHSVVHTPNYKKNFTFRGQDTNSATHNTTSMTEINTRVNVSGAVANNFSQISPGGSSAGTSEGMVYTCTQCPAVFLKESTLQHHLKMHEGNAKYRCDHCTYSVFSYSNLVRHARVHGVELPADAPDLNSTIRSDSSLSEAKKGDLEEETATFKCPKCPAVFDKKLGYDVHAGLHGSRQWFKCDRCDYSVKYEANLIRHRHLHDVHDERKAENNNNRSMLVNESDIPHGEMNESGASNTSVREVEHEPIMFRSGLREGDDTDSTGVKKLYQCPKCPYSHYSLNSVKMHLQRHISGSSEARCPHCDYGTNMQSFLREHIKLHFDPTRLRQVEAFAHWEELEVWVRSGVHKTLIYRYALGETDFSENDYRTEVVEPTPENKDDSSSKIGEQNDVEMTNGEKEISTDDAPELTSNEEREKEKDEPKQKEKEVSSSEPVEIRTEYEEDEEEEEEEEEEDISRRAVCFSPCPNPSEIMDDDDEDAELDMDKEGEEEDELVETEAPKLVENGKTAAEEESENDQMEVDSGEKVETVEKISEEISAAVLIPEEVIVPEVSAEEKMEEEASEHEEIPEVVERAETPVQDVEIEEKEEVVKAGTESPTAIVVPEPQELSKETVEKVEATEEEAIVDVCSEETGETPPLLPLVAPASEANVAADNLVEIMATDDTVIEEGTVSMDEMMTNEDITLNETCAPV